MGSENDDLQIWNGTGFGAVEITKESAAWLSGVFLSATDTDLASDSHEDSNVSPFCAEPPFCAADLSAAITRDSAISLRDARCLCDALRSPALGRSDVCRGERDNMSAARMTGHIRSL